MQPKDAAASSIASLPIAPNVLEALNNAREVWAEANLKFLTPPLLLVILELPDSKAAECFDQTRSGLAERWRGLLRRYQERALQGEISEFPPFQPFEWAELFSVYAANRLARHSGAQSIDELHLLHGILAHPSSRTRRELAEELGVEDYDRLRQIVRDRSATASS